MTTSCRYDPSRPLDRHKTGRPLTPFQWEEEMGEEVAALTLVQSIEANTKHYVEILSRAVDECMPEPSADPTYAKPKIPGTVRGPPN